jgi:hypothetical protein
MPTSIVSTASVGLDPTASDESIQLDIAVVERDWLGFYDFMEVWRSRQTASGPYEELTSENFKTARLPVGAGNRPTPAIPGPFINVSGQTLIFEVDRDDNLLEFTFTGVDPLTYSQLAAQIVAAGNNEVDSYVDNVGKLVVETTRVGTGAYLRCAGGTAAANLGFSTQEPINAIYGKDARLQLIQGDTSYRFLDQHGRASYHYKIRYRNSSTGAVSDFSQPMEPSTNAVSLSQDYMAVGVLDLVNIDGRPIANAQIRIFTNYTGTTVGRELVDGKLLAAGEAMKNTDENGHVEFTLIRGESFKVAIIGTKLVRTIVVPTDPAIKVFNLLDPSLSPEDDYFKVRVPDYIYAERRSL